MIVLDAPVLAGLPFFSGLFLFVLPGGVFMLAVTMRVSVRGPAMPQ